MILVICNSIYLSQVKCVRFGCLPGEGLPTEDGCKRFNVYYRNFNFGVNWYVRNFKITHSQIQRFVTVLLYVLYRNKFMSFANYFVLKSPPNSTCGFQRIGLYTSYRNNLNIQDVAKLRAWLASLQISYTETYNDSNDAQSIERLNIDKLYKTNADFRKQCAIRPFGRQTVDFQWDKDVLIRTLARYHTPFLFNFTCNHIHLTLSIVDKIDGNGKRQREYKPTEFYCVNGQSGNTINNWSTLFWLFCGLNIFRNAL